MSALTDFLEKHNIDYVRREILKYEGTGSRVSVPKEWSGSVIVVLEKINLTKALDDLREELQKNLESCKKMREISKGITTPCSAITDDILEKTKRGNDVCRRCPFGKKISQSAKIIESFYDTEDETKRKLAKEFFDKQEG